MPTPQPDSMAWNDALLRDPHHVRDKRQRVQKMFAAIAPSYDLNNRLHSLWQDQQWRRNAVKLSQLKPMDSVVDIACGTGDLLGCFLEQYLRFINLGQLDDFYGNDAEEPDFSKEPRFIGIDFTYEMLRLARRKYRGAEWLNGDAQSLPLPDQCCDVVSIAFGIRNVQDPAAAIRECRRILRPRGRLIILEFSLPTNPVLRSIYNFYFRQVLPRTATLISGDKTGAYKYLPESVNTFIGREQMMGMMREAGFADVEQHPMTFGVCVCYRGRVPYGQKTPPDSEAARRRCSPDPHLSHPEDVLIRATKPRATGALT